MASPPRRYQVFVSSTFNDLQDERTAVSQALLKMSNCFPIGMEVFPAASRPPWEVITGLLETTDYLVLLLSWRYGSTDETGISYTEREYDYARGLGIPVVAFSRARPEGLPASSREHDVSLRERVEEFRSKVLSRHTVQEWESSDRLATAVVTSLYQEFDSSPRPGWVRGHIDPPANGLPPETPVSPYGGPSTPSFTPDVTTPVDHGTLRRGLQSALERVRSLPALQSDVKVDGDPEFIRSTQADRLAALQEAMRGVLDTAYWAVDAEDLPLERLLLMTIPQLAPNPRASGSTDLINLRRAPGVLLFHGLGCAAAVQGRDELAGLLLGDRVVVDDPHRGEISAVASLSPDIPYPGGFPSRRLHDYLEDVLISHVGASTAALGWERWTFLYSVQIQYLTATGGGYRTSWPYLEVEATSSNSGLRTSVGPAIIREVTASGADHPLLRGGMCGSNPELFEAAATTFESNYSSWAKERDWEALPFGGGALPSQPHYPGQRSGD